MDATSNDCPPPPEIAGKDMRGYWWMQVSVDDIRNSELVAIHDAEPFRAHWLLRVAAWGQIPVSLPNDDKQLAFFAGFGRDVDRWRSIRELALVGWTLCRDGRLYHDALTKATATAWSRKQEQERFSEQQRSRARAGAAKRSSTSPSRSEPETGPGTAPAQPITVKNNRRDDRQETKKTSEETNTPERLSAPGERESVTINDPVAEAGQDHPATVRTMHAASKTGSGRGKVTDTTPYDAIRDLFAEHCPRMPQVGPVDEWSAARRASVRDAWKAHPDVEWFKRLFSEAGSSNYLCGKVERWCADFVWLLKPENAEKVRDGNFKNRPSSDSRLFNEGLRDSEEEHFSGVRVSPDAPWLKAANQRKLESNNGTAVAGDGVHLHTALVQTLDSLGRADVSPSGPRSERK